MSLATALRSDGTITVPAHELSAAVFLFAEGTVTEAKAKELARLPAHADADWESLKTVYNGKTSALAKLTYVLKIEAASMLYQTDDTLTEADLRAALEIA